MSRYLIAILAVISLIKKQNIHLSPEILYGFEKLLKNK